MLPDVIFTLIIAAFWALLLLSFVRKAASKTGRRRTYSSDGHVIPRDQDLTCERYGHEHGALEGRYIVHEDPPEGYVVLNGIKRRIEDCRNL